MPATLTSVLTAGLSATLVGDNAIASQNFAPAITRSLNLANGVSENQSDLLYIAQRNVGDGANDDLDLSGTLTDAFGNVLSFVEITAIMIVNAPKSGAANTTDLTIGNGANPFEGFISAAGTIGPLKPGAAVMLMSGNDDGLGTVTAATADILRIANGAGAAADYQIAITGRSAAS